MFDALIVPQAGMIEHRKGTANRKPHVDRCGAHQCSIPGKKKRETPEGVSRETLLLVNEMATAVLLPASFVAFCAEGFFLAVADGLDPAGADAGRRQGALDSAGALVAQGQVIVGGPSFVAVSFDRETHIGMLAEELRVGLHRRLLVAAKVCLVIVEINILDALTEQVFVGHVCGRRRWRWRRLGYRQSRCRFL